ncbi:MAG TPA: bestrophin family ion channel [Burkholderiaceae bacterium]|nr:bestrophin family ion channel [Burkholderiaceae bacterium]
MLLWTRRRTYVLVLLGIAPVVLYQVAGLKWLGIPWSAVALLGTATAFIVGFKNTQSYNRSWEARQIWGDIAGASRAWAAISRDFPINSPEKSRELVYRHLAWLTALRYQMRDVRPWETMSKPHNAEYRKRSSYAVPEYESALEAELTKYLPADEVKRLLATRNRAAQLMAEQSRTVKELFAKQEIVVLQFVDMQRSIRDFCAHQARSERIKDFPYPRQFATVNGIFIKLFCALLPFGLLVEFDKLGERLGGLMHGGFVWLVVPFSVLISWMYVALEQVGESTESPFEGSANDVPISQICRSIEIDLREMLGETALPPLLQPKKEIVL